MLSLVMARKIIARIGKKGTSLPPRLLYSKSPEVLAKVGANATAAVWGCEWSPAALAYLNSLDIPAMMKRQGLRHGRRNVHMAGFGIGEAKDINQQLYRVLKCFPRTDGYLQFARELRTNLVAAIQGANINAANISFLARDSGAFGVLHIDDDQPNTADPRRMLLTLLTSPNVRSTILDASASGLPPLTDDGKLFGDPDDPRLIHQLREMNAGHVGIWNMRGVNRAQVHSEPRVRIKQHHRLGLIAKRDGVRPHLLRAKRAIPVPSEPRLTVVITPF